MESYNILPAGSRMAFRDEEITSCSKAIEDDALEIAFSSTQRSEDSSIIFPHVPYTIDYDKPTAPTVEPTFGFLDMMDQQCQIPSTSQQSFFVPSQTRTLHFAARREAPCSEFMGATIACQATSFSVKALEPTSQGFWNSPLENQQHAPCISRSGHDHPRNPHLINSGSRNPCPYQSTIGDRKRAIQDNSQSVIAGAAATSLTHSDSDLQKNSVLGVEYLCGDAFDIPWDIQSHSTLLNVHASVDYSISEDATKDGLDSQAIMHEVYEDKPKQQHDSKKALRNLRTSKRECLPHQVQDAMIIAKTAPPGPDLSYHGDPSSLTESKKHTESASYQNVVHQAASTETLTDPKRRQFNHVTRFRCVYDFAGCIQILSHKNEWKRHVAKQHVGLVAWTCKINGCRSSIGFFNRKDLFTQHLRRMHMPSELFSAKHDEPNLAQALVADKIRIARTAWNRRVAQLQSECQVSRRQPPKHLGCPVHGCPVTFDGVDIWDAWMEHLGKHILGKVPSAVSPCPRISSSRVLDASNDAAFIEWSEETGILKRNGDDSWSLVGDAAARAPSKPVKE